MEASIPHGNDEPAVGDGERAGEMHGVSAPQGVFAGELAGVTLDGRRQLDRPRRTPELLPALRRLLEAISVEVMVPVGGGESRSHLGICEPARHGGVASVPERDRKLRSRLVDEQLHVRTCIGIDDRLLSNVARPPAGRPVGEDGVEVVPLP